MNKKQLNQLLVINLLTMTTFNMAHPVTPKLINELQFPSYMFGVFFALMAVANYVMSPIWGSLSDQKGRKRFLMIGVIGYGLSQVGFGLSTTLFPILIFRLLGGTFSICYITSALAYLTDLTEPKERMKYLSYHTATLSLGTSIGGLLGGYLGETHYEYTFIVQGLFCFVLLGIFAIYLKEIQPAMHKGDKLTVYLDHLKPKKTMFDLKSSIGIMILVMTFITITTTAYNSTINYYVESVLNMPSTVNGLVMAIGGMIALIMNVGVGPYLGKKCDEYKSIKSTTFIAGILLVLASVVSSPVLSLVFIIGFIASSALVVPIQQSIVSKIAKENYGEVMGVQGSAKALGMVIGSLGSGFIFSLGSKLPFFFAGLFALLAYLILKKLPR
ncbi:MAG: MFS transporter [Zhenhengia sp.]|uniref:MFS transporter n=1 Tax=Zhenhengia sp. TaxID=2944208 RepID=UPI00290F0D6C|nr:MFS transporter [Clostridiales bacterium]MDU6974208.1 MFS transporter [Clostridiales bacterium]